MAAPVHEKEVEQCSAIFVTHVGYLSSHLIHYRMKKKLLKSLLITKPVFLQIMTVLLHGIHYCAAELVSERMFYLTFFLLLVK